MTAVFECDGSMLIKSGLLRTLRHPLGHHRAAIGGISLFEHFRLHDAIYPEMAIIPAKFAPGGDQRDIDIIDRSYGPDRASRSALESKETIVEFYPTMAHVQPRDAVMLGSQIADTDEAERIAKNNNFEILEPPKETPLGYRIILADPDGRRVLLYSRPSEKAG
jgi:hypothetical protein